ncbi:MAG: S9 family peptidase [Planctomycetota bacterium]|nr:S9 family peptidase [Planctomycetota bacterium]
MAKSSTAKKRPAPRRKSVIGRTSKTSGVATREIKPKDLQKFVLVGDPQISPDGATVLFTRKHVGEKLQTVSNLWMAKTTGRETRLFTNGEKDSHGRWSPEGSQIAFIGEREKGNPQVFVIPSAGGEAVQLTQFPEGKLRSFRWSPDGKMLAVAFRETEDDFTSAAKKRREETGESDPPRVIDQQFYRLDGDGYFNDKRHELFIVDVCSGEHRLLFDKDNCGFFNFDWSPDSRELAVTANTADDAIVSPWKSELFRIDVRAGKVKKLQNTPVGSKSSVAWSPDGKWIAFAGREGKEIWGSRNTKLYVCDAKTGQTRDLSVDHDYCLAVATLSDTAEAEFGATIVWSRDSRRIFSALGWHGTCHIASQSIEGGLWTFHTEGPAVHTLGNISDDGKTCALTQAHTLTPPNIGIGNLEIDIEGSRPTVTALTDFNDTFLKSRQLSQPESFWTESADGTPVQLWIMKPAGFKAGKKYPTVLEVHGGPHTQYGEAFFHEFQVLAAAGYVVCFSNPRGSKGYGEAFCDAIRGSWGIDDWADVQAVTKFLKNQPFVDKKRVGIMGGSYGGFMTNWAIGHSQDYLAAITDRCVANLVSMVGSSDIPLIPNHYWPGNSWDNPQPLWDRSPLNSFGKVTAPTLIIHSEGDLRCNVEQGEQVFAALKLRGIPCRFVRYPQCTSHGLSRCGPPDLRIHRLKQILEWWERWL